MRKKIVVLVITALCLFVSASPWEGAAVAAPEGELPAAGRYIATNSFPRNTVVDIVNIETNKSTRVIVAGNLDSPGLLAIVSKEAAELIGMRPGSVSRIRMTQPSDPVAYVRFTEGLTSGIYDYDSGEVITEDNYDEFVNPAAPPARVTSAPPIETAPYDPYPAPAPAVAVPETGYPSYMLEPEWGGALTGTRSARDIVDLPANTASEKKPEAPEPNYMEDYEEIAEPVLNETVPTEKTAEAVPEDDYDEITEAVPTEAVPAEAVPEDNKTKIAEAVPEDEEDYDDYEAIAEAYPEVDYYDEDFFDEPDEIAEAEEEIEEYEDIVEVDYYDEPEKIAEYNIVPTDDRPPSSVYGIDPSLIIPGITNPAKPETPVRPSVTVSEPDPSVPRINELARGSYYVQLASYDTAESAQSGLSRIDQHYKPVVYNDSGRYRVLLGPLNQGESAAVLARFKSIGYKDAFVRVAK